METTKNIQEDMNENNIKVSSGSKVLNDLDDDIPF